jgi:hypothetical protein
MSEPALTYLMPVYNIAAWALLLKRPDDFSLPTALLGAAWALWNTILRKRLDGGVISMGLVAVAAGAEKQFFGGANASLILIQVRFAFVRVVDVELRLSPSSLFVITMQAVGSIVVCLNYALPLVKWDTLKKVRQRELSPRVR